MSYQIVIITAARSTLAFTPLPLKVSKILIMNNFRKLSFASHTGSVSTVTLAYDEASATLTCTSAGGPATSVSWTKDGAPVEVDGVSYQQTQIVLNTATATYENRLTIAQRESRLSGLYRCTVENSRGSMASQEVQVTGKMSIIELR